MNYSTRRFALDLHKTQSQISIAAFRNDTAVKLSILITDGGSPYRFEEGVIAVLWGTKEDGKPISHSCSIEESTRIIYEFNDTTTDDVGVIDCQIRFYKGGEQILSAPKFSIVVSERVGNYDEIESYEYEDGEYGKYFAQQFSSLGKIITAENERVEAENVRKENERIRKEAYAQVDAKLESKLDKTKEANKIYGTNANGEQLERDVSASVLPSRVVQRTGGSEILVTEKPASDFSATSKKYVDKLANSITETQNSLDKRVTQLESLTLSFPEITSTDYEKVVPANVGDTARLIRVGNKTEKVRVSKNLFNPNDSEIVLDTGSDLIWLDYTVDNEGWMTFTVPATEWVNFAKIDLWELVDRDYLNESEANGYYVLLEGGGVPESSGVSYTGEVRYFNDFNLDSGEGVAVEYKTRIMLYKHSDAELFKYDKIFPAPEGTVFELYSTNCFFRKSIIERVESCGKNLAEKKYGIKSSGAEINSTVLAVDDTGKNCYSLIPVTGGKTYTISKSGSIHGGSAFRYFYFDKEPVLLETKSIGGAYVTTLSETTFTTPNNAKYLYVRWTEDDINYPCGDVQIEFGDTATEYVPHHAGPIDSIEFPIEANGANGAMFFPEEDLGNGIDDTAYNYFWYSSELKEWQYCHDCREITLTGTEDWQLQSVNANGIANFSLNISPSAVSGKGMCSDRDYDSTPIANATDKGIHVATDNIYIRDNAIRTVAEWKSYLAEHYDDGNSNANPVRIIYKALDIGDSYASNAKALLKVEPGGFIRFVSKHKIPVPNTVGFVTRKE